VLDVACGTGVLAREAARRVGANGLVAGLDPEPGMLAVAAQLAPAIEWRQGVADSLPYDDDSFDAVVSQFGLMFFPDRPAALREMRRVLVPDGRALVNVPMPTPFFNVLDDALIRHAGEAAGAFVRAVFSLNEPARMQQLFSDAGFSDVTVKVETRTLRLPPAQQFLWQYVSSTPLAGLAAELDDEHAQALERDVIDGWKPWSDKDGMSIEQGVIVATGRR
jgi:ubiquinone/menaquinone biosynthesis C-methylase UbiE